MDFLKPAGYLLLACMGNHMNLSRAEALPLGCAGHAAKLHGDDGA